MQFFIMLGQLFKVALFFLNLYSEKDKKKAEEKAELGKEVINAFKETDPNIRASKLNALIHKL